MVNCPVSLQGQESDLVEEVTSELSRALKINKVGQGNEGKGTGNSVSIDMII